MDEIALKLATQLGPLALVIFLAWRVLERVADRMIRAVDMLTMDVRRMVEQGQRIELKIGMLAGGGWGETTPVEVPTPAPSSPSGPIRRDPTGARMLTGPGVHGIRGR
jgi:hypothetical protein